MGVAIHKLATIDDDVFFYSIYFIILKVVNVCIGYHFFQSSYIWQMRGVRLGLCKE